MTLLKPYNFRKTMKKLKIAKEMSVLILFSQFLRKVPFQIMTGKKMRRSSQIYWTIGLVRLSVFLCYDNFHPPFFDLK